MRPVFVSDTPSLIALSGTLQPPRVSLRYRAALVLVAVTMLVLPLLYLCVLLGAVWLVWWHVVNNTWIVAGSANQLTGLAYVTPIIAGAILVFFMVKPVIARPARRRDPIPLSPESEPDVFQFVDAIRKQVRAPMPRRVEVDCRVNASASFLPVRFGLLKRELVLTIGLPLVAGLSVRELGGVLAHEFGHFAQGSGMRATGLVRMINHWFARVVYERDHWDAKIDEWSRDHDWRALIVVALARGGIWVSRRMLAGLMSVGHAVSCVMLRQMEYDADGYEIRLAGSATFVRTFVRLRELNAAAQCAYQELQRSWQTRTLPADLPRFIVQHESAMPEAARAAIRDAPGAATRFWDTHPSDADRVRAADMAADPGIVVGGDGPAAMLFRQFDALSAEATRHHYAHDLGLDVREAALVDGQGVTNERQRREDLRKILGDYFGECISLRRPLAVSCRDVATRDDSQLRAAIADARNTMTSDAASVAGHYRRFEWYAQRRVGALAAEEFLLAGGTIEDTQGISELAEPTLESASATQAWTVTMRDENRPSLDRFEAAAVQRLACGIVLGDRSHASGEAAAAIATLEVVARHVPDALEVQEHLEIIRLLSRVLHGKSSQGLSQRTNALVARITETLRRVFEGLGGTTCPATLTAEPRSIAAWCGVEVGHERIDASRLVESLLTVYWHALAQVVTIAMAAEESVE